MCSSSNWDINRSDDDFSLGLTDRRWWSISKELAHSVSFQSKQSQLWVVILLCITSERYCRRGTEIRSAELTRQKRWVISCSLRKHPLTASTDTYPTGHCAHCHPAGIFYPQHTLKGDQVNLVTLHQQVKNLMAPQYVHWKLKPVSNLCQPGRNLEKNQFNVFLSWQDFFCLILTIVFIKGLPIFLMKNKVVSSEVQGKLRDNFLPCLSVSHKQMLPVR